MAKRSAAAAAAAAPESRSRRGAHAVRLLQRIHHRFLRLLGATTPKTASRTAKSARKVARPREPKSLIRAADEKQEQDVEARSPDAAAVSASEAAVAGKYWAHRGCYVVAVEIDPRKVELAALNARVYGVEDRIEFIVGDFFRLAPFLKADLVFLSPPWGGPSYIQAPVYTLDMLKPKDGYATFRAAQKIAPNIMMFLPRTVDVTQVEELSWLSCPPLHFESEENYVHRRFKGITAYFGRR